MTNRLKSYLALLTVSAIWGIAGPVIKLTLKSLPPFTFLFWRFLISSVVLFIPFLIYLKKHPVKKTDLPSLFFMGLLSTTINLSLIFLGFEKTTALDGILLSSVTPIFIVVLGVIILKEKVERKEAAGLILIVLGSFITVIQPFLEGKAFATKNILGNLLILIAGVEWALFVLFSKENFKRFSPFLLMTSGSFVGLATFLPLSFLEQWIKGGNLAFSFLFLPPQGITFWGVVYMAILSYILAYFLYEYALQFMEISESTPFSYLQPIFAAPFALLWLKESLSFPFLLGVSIIIAGVVLSEKK